jgi:hypothetical protein
MHRSGAIIWRTARRGERLPEPLTPPPIQHPISEAPAGLTPRPWSRYFDAVRTQVLALVGWSETLLATTPPPPVAATSATGTAETAARGDHTHGGGATYTNEEAQDAVGTILVDTATIDLTYSDATPAITAAVVAGSIGTTQLANDAVTYAKLQNVTDARLLGRSAGSAGDVQELTVGTGLTLSSGVLGVAATTVQAQIDALNARLTALEQPQISKPL